MPLTPELIRLLAVLEDASIKDARDGLEKLRDLYSTWLMYSTGAVAIGVALEAPEIIGDICEQYIRWRRGYVPSEFDRHTGMPTVEGINWKKVIGAIGWVLIVAGVVFEGRFESLVSEKNTSIQSIDLAHVSGLDKEVIAAQQSATGAYNSALDAHEQAKAASDRAKSASEDAATAHRDAERANKHAAELDLKNKALEEKNLKTESDLLNFIVCNAPRLLPFWTARGKTSEDAIRPFAGRLAIIEYLPDLETHRAAFSIAASLRRAKWVVEPPRAVNDNLNDGVWVQPIVSGGPDPTREVADELVKFLHSYNWQAQRLAIGLEKEGLPVGSLKISVGLYPAVAYVSSPGSAPLDLASREFDARMQELRAKHDEELLSHLTPEEQKAMKEMDSRIESHIKEEQGPCQVLAH